MFAGIRDRNWTLLDVALAVAVTALAVVILTLSWALTHDEQWKPLGPFPVQSVTNSTTVPWPAAGGGNVQIIPAVGVAGGVVFVEGTKCYREQVTVNGEFEWNVVEPPGRTVSTGKGTSVKQQGCTTGQFENEVPAELAEFARRSGREFIVVTISGCETPTDPDRGEGATLCWTTEPFALVP